ncbi:uncharacterized protein LOC134223202 [Armigeres subalbatus]|uniref:uncharacterized protein LOC134223202 n=1 Tax=Armigeres subalbatus TaxID=124917 RepID=UPI002ED69809
MLMVKQNYRRLPTETMILRQPCQMRRWRSSLVDYGDNWSKNVELLRNGNSQTVVGPELVLMLAPGKDGADNDDGDRRWLGVGFAACRSEEKNLRWPLCRNSSSLPAFPSSRDFCTLKRGVESRV